MANAEMGKLALKRGRAEFRLRTYGRWFDIVI